MWRLLESRAYNCNNATKSVKTLLKFYYRLQLNNSIILLPIVAEVIEVK